MKPKSTIIWLITILEDLMGKKFFGEITLKFNDGKIVHLEKRMSMVPPRE